MDLMGVIPLFGGIQGFFLSLILFTLKSGRRRANRVLAFLILSIALTIANPITADIQEILVILIMVFGPLFLIYVFFLTKPDYRWTFGTGLHLVPYVVATALVVVHFATQGRVIPRPFIRSIYILKNFHALGYSVVILVYLNRYRHSLKQRYSNIERLSLSWISIILALFILYFAVISPIVLIFYVSGIHWILDVESAWTPILVSIYIFFLGFNGIRHHQVFVRDRPSQKETRERFTDDQIDRLVQVVESDKIYLMDDLTLDSLSEAVGIPSHLLSRIINTKYEMNFFDYVNSYRVNYFNTLYLDETNAHRTILDMAMESGFYSKSTFNLSYKKSMGMTPTQFRKDRIVPK